MKTPKWVQMAFAGVLLLALLVPGVAAQEGSDIEFYGAIQSLDGSTWVVNGLTVDVSGMTLAFTPEVGQVVRVVGLLQPDTTVIVTLIELTETPSAIAFTVAYQGRTYDPASDQTTFAYVVAGTGTPPDLSHFDLAIPACDPVLNVVAANPADAVSIGVDPTTGIDGIKWDLPLLVTDTRTYSVTLAGDVDEGSSVAAVYGAGDFETYTLPGPACTVPDLTVQKSVSVDGGTTWADADVAPGPAFPLDGQVSFLFAVTNQGAAPLTNVTLSDDMLDTSACSLPAVLEAGVTFECTVGPVPVAAGQHTNTVTVTADLEGVTVSATDRAHYFGGTVAEDDDDLPVVIVIEGPVQEINVNVITIYDIDIEIDPDNTLLNVIQIGDVIRVDGSIVNDADIIVIIAINIVFVDVDVFVNDDGQVWRDNGNCGNAPPPWAPANGWRRRCDPGSGGSGSRS